MYAWFVLLERYTPPIHHVYGCMLFSLLEDRTSRQSMLPPILPQYNSGIAQDSAGFATGLGNWHSTYTVHTGL